METLSRFKSGDGYNIPYSEVYMNNYYGDILPELGEYIFDSEENVWVLRVRLVDEPFSCGVECCGVENPACQAFETEAEAIAAAEKVKSKSPN